MFRQKPDDKYTPLIISVIVHIIVFSLLIFIPDKREFPVEEVTEVVIPDHLKEKLYYPSEENKKVKKDINVKKRKHTDKRTIQKSNKNQTKKSEPRLKDKIQKRKPPAENRQFQKKEQLKKDLPKKKKPVQPQKKVQKKPIPKNQKIIVSKDSDLDKLKENPLSAEDLVVGDDKKSKGPVKGKDNLPPGGLGEGEKSMFEGISKREPKNPDDNTLIIPYGGKSKIDFGKGAGFGVGGGWKDYGASASFDTHGINIDPWIKEVIQKVKRNWIPPTAAKYGLRGYNVFYVVFSRDGTLKVFKSVKKSEILSFDLSSKNAIASSIPFPEFPNYYTYDDVKAQFHFYYNLYPSNTH